MTNPSTTLQSRRLHAAKVTKQDEFYTQLSDIEKELKHYTKHFKGKTVLCNCDDPRISNFFKYFVNNFEKLGLKQLITTCYKNRQADLFSKNDSEMGIYFEYSGEQTRRLPDPTRIKPRELKADGDFRSNECVELLKQADIVVTNPPFSLFREYVSRLVTYKKKFVIIGNQNAITYKNVFKLIKENGIWLGASIHSGDREFGIPDHYPLNAAGTRVDKDGNKFIRVKGVRWFTNLDYAERHDHLPLYAAYTPEKYPTYENYDAIEVSKTKDIPMDYDGVIGVPITFLDKYSPEQFEIVGMCENENLYNLKTKVYTTAECKAAYLAKFGKKGTYDLNASGVLYRDGLLEKVYQRVLIKRK